MNTLITTDDGEILEVSTSMIEQQSEHSMKVSTAKRFPRSLKTFRSQVLELSTLDEDSAASMFYVLPRGKKNIEGPSIRFAELVATAYGNLSYAARIIDEQERFIVAQGVCYDYEKNLSVAIEVRLRITNSNGDRYNDDMIQVTGRAACARALREAIFKVVPRAYWSDILDAAKKASIGVGETLDKQVAKCLEYWFKAGASKEKVLAFFGYSDASQITVDDIVVLRGLATAMREEGLAVDRVLSRDEFEQRKNKMKKNDLPTPVEA